MRFLPTRRASGALLGLFSLAAIALAFGGVFDSGPASAYIDQADGQVVPISNRVQQCLDRSGTGETTAGAVDAVSDAQILPEAYRPVEDPPGSGRYEVTFQAIGEGAGYKNSFGWYWIGEDVTTTSNLHRVFACRTGGSCACPCNPSAMRSDTPDTATSHTVTIDFADEAGFAPGRAVGFWIRTPELLAGGTDGDNCGSVSETGNRIYFTSKSLNDDGDYLHFLVYRSATRDNTFYFGFEDLFRGGDNDFEDMMVRTEGLVPFCEPEPEACDGEDNDCDLNIDEGVSIACSTACGPGERICVAGSYEACDARTASTETCDAEDNDCDTRVDEGLSRACSNSCGAGTELCVAGAYVDCNAPTAELETCNGEDDDCDGMIDESITRACRSACGSGIETCTLGGFVGCTAPTAGIESCNGLDDDCDARVDEGLTQACSSACGAGLETCVSGDWVGCTANAPSVETCNNVDDDCDGTIDEDLERTCSSICGNGTERCEMGTFVGCDAAAPGVETCNNIDDDCDGVIDDGNPGGGALCLPNDDGSYEVIDAPGKDDTCSPGTVRCISGALSCLGSTGLTQEICNCEDDDCDGNIDEDTSSSICPGGACVGCECVSPCATGEFECPPGQICDRALADPEREVAGYCVAGKCDGVTCTDQEVCDPLTGACNGLCDNVACRDGFLCVRGACVEDSCYGLGCPSGERCVAGSCEADLCSGVSCEGETFCRAGVCIAACRTPCSFGQTCVNGACQRSECAQSCPSSTTCIEGECVTNDCEPRCGRDRICQGTECVDDPCADITCPSSFECQRGECVVEGYVAPTRPVVKFATGGGGLSCSVQSGGTTGTIQSLIGLVFLAMVQILRKQRARRWARGLRRAGKFMFAAAALQLAACDVHPFCFENCEEPSADAGPGVTDAGPPQDARNCVPTGGEDCDGQDNDCDGFIDEDFDLQTDPLHCGACETTCALPDAFPSCEAGECTIDRCAVGHYDINGVPADGCEYACPPAGAESCNDRDDDCDMSIDEGFNTTDDPQNCGACGVFCAFANGVGECVASVCELARCATGFLDLDGNPDNGCEVQCTPTGSEVCDGQDNNCNGTTDEGFDTATDEANCGVCGRTCSFLNASATCTTGVCTIGTCATNHYDIDGNPLTGCEYACTPDGVDDCDGRDNDCDNRVDESEPLSGTACGTSAGACEQGLYACQFGTLTCLGDLAGTPETCNGIDDDCDGATDDAPSGTGVRCGATNVGACNYGTTVCTSGALRCGGTLVEPTDETCNGVDDDCDGTADDTPSAPVGTPTSCAETRGVCAGRAPSCRGVSGWQCSFPDTYQSAESICDGLDNDCDGSTDEGCWTVGPTSDVRIDTGDAVGESNSLSVSLAGDGASRVYATWMERSSDDQTHVLFNRSTDAGSSFASTGGFPFRLDSSDGPAIGPVLGTTSSGQNVLSVWADFRGGENYREIYRKLDTNFGGTWGTTDTRENPGQNTDSFNLDLTTSGTNAYAVYENFASDRRSRHVYFVRSTDSGSTWGTPIQIDSGGSTIVAANPRVAAVGTNVYVVWRDNRNGGLDIYFDRSSTSGSAGSFSATDKRLDVGTAAGASTSFAPTMAAEGNNVYVAWVDAREDGAFDIWTNHSTDSGANFRTSDSIRVDDDALPHDSIEPHIVAPLSGTAIVAWIDYRAGFPDVYAARTTDSGASYADPVRLDTGADIGESGSYDLALGASGQRLVAAWADDRSGSLDIYANFSLDGGANWQPQDYRMDATATPGSSDSESPVVYVTETAGHVAWVDNRNGANADIYYRRLTN